MEDNVELQKELLFSNSHLFIPGHRQSQSQSQSIHYINPFFNDSTTPSAAFVVLSSEYPDYL